MIHRAETIAFVIAIIVSAVVLGGAVGIVLVRGVLHLSWWVGRRLDAAGRRGDVLEALARDIEANS